MAEADGQGPALDRDRPVGPCPIAEQQARRLGTEVGSSAKELGDGQGTVFVEGQRAVLETAVDPSFGPELGPAGNNL